ncbi:hypothetical protein FLAG1_08831 [Fusarium langsethiae]|uniref:CBM-cenC domain-containing protein n=1 Tax=Fusarium langsethiae TaxID=179993 RepID=A0A0N0V5W2_FUSLA|nr:hypothetical protein FLAG1_08831 [Fusarium langsethiae]GKU06406.1 unnamed protein product [Fusarium langsethiae]
MRVQTTLGSLILSAGLCAARTSETETTTAVGSVTTEIAGTTLGATSEETMTVTESDTAVEPSETLPTSGFETSTIEISTTSVAEASTRTIEDSTTTTTSPAHSVQSPPNGDFEDPTLEPWVSTGTTAVFAYGNYCYEKNQCVRLPGPYSGNNAKICQRVEVEQGYEYTFSAHLRQSCSYYNAREGEDIDCSPFVNTVQLYIDGVSSFSKPVDWDNQWHEYSDTFQYTGPSIDSTSLCIAVVMTQGDNYDFFVDAVSLVRGKSVPIPEES